MTPELQYPKSAFCCGFFVAQDSVEALRTASERQARLGPPRISIFASRRPWGVSLVLHDDLKEGSWRWSSSWRLEFLWRFVFVFLFGMCTLLVKWDAFTSLELKLSGDFFARLWKEIQLPSQGGRWRAKITLAEYIRETCKSNTMANWPSTCETQGGRAKSVYRVFVKHILGLLGHRRFGDFLVDPLSSWAAWYFSVLYTPLVLMLGEKGRTLVVEQGGPVGYP